MTTPDKRQQWRDAQARRRAGLARVRTPVECGTPAGYRRHLRRAEAACAACLTAWAERRRAERASG